MLQVTIVDELSAPDSASHPLAASTDISKLIRGDYADSTLYTEMWLDSLRLWNELNVATGRQIFHQTGLLVLSSTDATPSAEQSFEQKSLFTQQKYGVPVSLFARADVTARYPRWKKDKYRGYLNERGGWAESGEATVALLQQVH